MIPFVLFSMRRAWQGFWRNALMSLAATLTMVLMLLLLAAMLVSGDEITARKAFGWSLAAFVATGLAPSLGLAPELPGSAAAPLLARQVWWLGTAISSLARAEGVSKIMLPGERGDAVRAEREQNGIPIPKGTWQRITKAAQTVGVTPPM